MGADRTPPLVIGWTEYVDLPEWGIRGLRAKVDTGARTSALHVDNVLEVGDHVTFDVVLRRRERSRRVRVRTRIVRRGGVRSSTGERTRRLFVRTALRLGPVAKYVEVSLVDRGEMIHRMLLGRSALTGPILIDVNRRLTLEKTRRPRKPLRK